MSEETFRESKEDEQRAVKLRELIHPRNLLWFGFTGIVVEGYLNSFISKGSPSNLTLEIDRQRYL